MPISIEKTHLPGAVLLTPRRFGDARGWFTESWSAQDMAAAGFDLEFVQDNHSFSAPAGTLRGLHCQAPPQAQDKLVRCTRGVIFDVAVDIRRGSPTYGKWVGAELSAKNGRQFLIPKGFLHGFVTRVADCEVQYKCSAPYAADTEHAVIWNDADLAIDWGLDGMDVTLSDKDQMAGTFKELKTPFVY